MTYLTKDKEMSPWTIACSL